ncbi:hypothetical protein O181_049153 [Austropuccinia psidii MF-1]|uniref:Uncharacterized protein n=1 Tax=Austropuccinia psidii MF-1 TaxID=1389203 RepID=A0A9Q3HL51_9BASI|nr:hypothetical protein [Austropuccinia psidii MF-1]
MLLHFGELVQCTNIVGAKAVKQEDSTRFAENYDTYQKTSLKLFPQCRHVPNHHYAMHIPDQLKFWGPPMGISEFSGERLIGELQNLKCNFLPGAMDATFMLKFCQRQRLEVLNEDKNDPESTPLRKKVELNDDTYYALLEYLQQSHPNLRDHRMLPHPSSSLVLRRFAQNLKSISWVKGSKLSTEPPNDCIKFKKGKQEKFGKAIYILDLCEEEIHSGPLIILEEYEVVRNRDQFFEHVDTFLNGLDLSHVVPSQRLCFIPVKDVLGLAAYLCLPAGSLGSKKISFLLQFINKFVGLERKQG